VISVLESLVHDKADLIATVAMEALDEIKGIYR
jgi:hypothetical protein